MGALAARTWVARETDAGNEGGKLMGHGDGLLNRLFGCGHQKLSRPITPVDKTSSDPAITYVVCLDCGQQFHYDTVQMRIGARVSNVADK